MYADLLRNPQPSLQQPPLATAIGHQAAPALSRAHHQQINHWTLKDWTSHKANVRQAGIMDSGDETAALNFIESANGIPVSTERIKAVRRSCRELFFSLKIMYTDNRRPVPLSWGLMSHSDKRFFSEKIKEYYPELAFCEDNWKCEYVATHTYPGWYRTHVSDKKKVKQEPGTKQQSKIADSSGSPAPAPDGAPGHLSLATQDSGTSPVTPTLNLGPDSFNLDSKVLEPSQDPNPTQGPTLSLESPSSHPHGLEPSTTPLGPAPPVSTNAPLYTTNQSSGVAPPPGTEVATPATIGPLERETTPSVSIQVCLPFLSSPTPSPITCSGFQVRNPLCVPTFHPRCSTNANFYQTAPHPTLTSYNTHRHHANNLHAA